MCCARHAAPAARTSAHRAVRHGGPNTASSAPPRGVGSVFWRDAQAGVPSARRPRAQLAFKDSMVRGILQFTPGIAFRYVLHRCESRDIRCRESCGLLDSVATREATGAGWPGRSRPRLVGTVFLDAVGAVGSVAARPPGRSGLGRAAAAARRHG